MTTEFALGIDVGSTTTAAAVYRDGLVEMASLSGHSHDMPTAVYLRTDGTLVAGDSAMRAAANDPTRAAVDFKRDIALRQPRLLAGKSVDYVDLFAALLRHVLTVVREREGAAPAHVTLTHPAEWDTWRRDLLASAAARAGLVAVGLCPEPVAAATHYASLARVRLAPGATLAVYDLGGATFDVAVVAKTADSLEVLAHGGLDSLGGTDFDALVLSHVLGSLDASAQAAAADPEAYVALERLSVDVRDRKEQLSEEVEATVPLLLPGAPAQVRVTRQDFEHLAHPLVAQSVAIFADILAKANVPPERLDRVLLVGGASRMPIVAELLSGALPGAMVHVDAHPKWPIALGAAIIGGAALGSTSRVGAPSSPEPAKNTPAMTASDTFVVDLRESQITGLTDVPIRPAVDLRLRRVAQQEVAQIAAAFGPADVDERQGSTRRALVVVGVLVVLLTATLIVVALAR